MAKTPKAPIVDRELIRELTKLLEETGLTEIEIEQDGQRVRVARNAAAPSFTAPRAVAAPAPQPVAHQLHGGDVRPARSELATANSG